MGWAWGWVGGVGGGGDAVFVDVGDDGVVLGEEGEEEGGRACWEVVDCVEGEGPDEES